MAAGRPTFPASANVSIRYEIIPPRSLVVASQFIKKNEILQTINLSLCPNIHVQYHNNSRTMFPASTPLLCFFLLLLRNAAPATIGDACSVVGADCTDGDGGEGVVVVHGRRLRQSNNIRCSSGKVCEDVTSKVSAGGAACQGPLDCNARHCYDCMCKNQVCKT